MPDKLDAILKRNDELGGRNAYNYYAAGWAVAGDIPFTWTKQVILSVGDTRNGMIVYWPKRIRARNALRSQFHHVIDVTPTVLEACGVPEPTVVNGFEQHPIEGVSMVYTFDDAKAKDRHTTQYFEIFCNRTIYHDGWVAGTMHKAPWEPKPRVDSFDNNRWELYNVTEDFSQSTDLAAEHPEKLKELQDLFLKEAAKYQVLPLDDRLFERFIASMVGRPDLMEGRTSMTLHEGMTGMRDNVFINVKNRSHTITAELEVPKEGIEGVILCQCGRCGGWSLYTKGGKLNYCYNWVGLEQYKCTADEALPAGKVAVNFEFGYDGGGLGKGGKGTLSVNGNKVAEGRIEHTASVILSPDETADVGVDEATNVTDDYEEQANTFTGTIDKTTVTLEPK